MSDQDYSQFGEKELELMVLEEDRHDKYEVYLELFRRYSEKNDLEKATLSIENLITSFDGKIEKGALINARYRQALLHFYAENFDIALDYASKGLNQWVANSDSDSFFYNEWCKCALVELRSSLAIGFISGVPEKAQRLLDMLEIFKLENYVSLTYMIIAEAYFHLEKDDLCEENLKLAKSADPDGEDIQKGIDHFRNAMAAEK
jgi:hypothetical protein